MIQVGFIYKTKFQTGEHFIVKEIRKTYVMGIYINALHLGLCPLNIDRLVI